MPKYYHISILDSCANTPLEFNYPNIAPASLDSIAQQTDSLKILNQTQIFGSTAQLNTTIANNQPHNSPQNWQPTSLTLLLICLLCFAIYRYTTTIRIILKNIWSINSTLNLLENPSREFFHFITISKITLTIALATFATSITTNLLPSLSPYFIALTLAIALTIILIFTTQGLINRTCGSTSNAQYTFHSIRQLGNLNAATAAYVVTPTIILTTLNPSLFIWTYIPLAIITLFHIFRVFVYLKYEKFSFLQWFLYLCAVELMPLTLPILLLTLFWL